MTQLLIAFTLLIAVFALTTWKAARHERAAEASWPPVGDFLMIDGHRVHYHVTGHGPDLVLIHGASGNVRDFTFDLVDRLSDRYRVIVIDRPGLGYTDRINRTGATLVQQADLLRRAAAELGAPRPLIMGHSYGGAVALAWAVHFPDSVSGLTLLAAASNPWTTGIGPYYRMLSHPLGQAFVVPILTAWVPDRVVDDTIDRVFLPDRAPPGYHPQIGSGLTLRRVSMRANALQRANLLDEIIAQVPRYGDITVPVEIVHGDADRTVPLVTHSAPLAQQVPTAALTVLEGIGHMPHHAAPEATVDAIDRMARRAGLP